MIDLDSGPLPTKPGFDWVAYHPTTPPEARNIDGLYTLCAPGLAVHEMVRVMKNCGAKFLEIGGAEIWPIPHTEENTVWHFSNKVWHVAYLICEKEAKEVPGHRVATMITEMGA